MNITPATRATAGLGFTQSLYEQERFEEVLKVASDIRAARTGVASAPHVAFERFRKETFLEGARRLMDDVH